MTDVLLCVGNSMMGDDGAGPLLAEKCAAAPKGNWVVIDGGSAPETTLSLFANCARHGCLLSTPRIWG